LSPVIICIIFAKQKKDDMQRRMLLTLVTYFVSLPSRRLSSRRQSQSNASARKESTIFLFKVANLERYVFQSIIYIYYRTIVLRFVPLRRIISSPGILPIKLSLITVAPCSWRDGLSGDRVFCLPI
jgi:hypothetical protein